MFRVWVKIRVGRETGNTGIYFLALPISPFLSKAWKSVSNFLSPAS